jgi:hypothetical protein
VPAAPRWIDSKSVELGVKFRSDLSGFITGVRFYKGTGNGGTHVGSLWTSNGTLLSTATFSGETQQGWQQVNFSTPVAIHANTTYVASYLAPAGNYSVDVGYFANRGRDRGPLHALRDGASGGNGLYTYSATSAFPTISLNSNNYWVDPVFFRPTAPPTTPDLRPEDDSGSSNSDNLTNSTAPTFTGTAQAGSTVKILANGVEVGSAVADDQRRYSVTVTGGIAEGTYLFTATTTVIGAYGQPETLLSPGSLQVRFVRSVFAPSTPDLEPDSDSGSSNTDNITNSAAPVFVGVAEADTTVTLFSDGIAIGQQPVGAESFYRITAPTLNNGTRQITAQAMDAAGNVSTSAPLSVVIDSTAPVADVVDIAPDPRNTSVAQVQITFSEPVAGLAKSALLLTRDGASVSLTDATLSGPAADGRTYTLGNLAEPTRLAGTYEVKYVAAGSTVRDPAGNSPTADAADAWVMQASLNAVPTALAIIPDLAADPVDTFRTFTTQYRDADGVADMQIAYLKAGNPSGALLTVSYYAPANKLYVIAEDGVTALGGFVPGSANTISNSLGTLDVAGTSVTMVGDNLTIVWRLSAKAPLTGQNQVQTYARDRAFGSSNVTTAAWTVGVNALPTVVGMTPANAADPVGAFRTFTSQYRDADGAEDISIAYLKATNPSGLSLMVSYYAPNNKLYLIAEDGVTVLGGFTPGSANTISNSLGTLDVAGTSVTKVGDTLTINWRLSSTTGLTGLNHVQNYGRDRTALSNVVWGTWNVNNPANVAPVAVGITPAVASDPVGTSRTFTAEYRDADGVMDIPIVYLRVRNPSGATMTAVYYAPNNKLYLIGDDGATVLGGFAPGSANPISNSLGTLDVAGTSVTRVGDTLTVNWRLSLKATMAGNNELQIYGRDRTSLWTRVATASWTIS